MQHEARTCRQTGSLQRPASGRTHAATQKAPQTHFSLQGNADQRDIVQVLPGKNRKVTGRLANKPGRDTECFVRCEMVMVKEEDKLRRSWVDPKETSPLMLNR